MFSPARFAAQLKGPAWFLGVKLHKSFSMPPAVFGGYRESGLWTRGGGREGLLEYLEPCMVF